MMKISTSPGNEIDAHQAAPMAVGTSRSGVPRGRRRADGRAADEVATPAPPMATSLSRRDVAVLRAVAAGRCAMSAVSGGSLTVDGLCCDQFVGLRLASAGLPLLQRMQPRQRCQLRQHLSMPRQLDIQHDAVLQRQQAPRLQPIALGADVLTPGPAERIAPPQRKARTQFRHRLERITGVACLASTPNTLVEQGHVQRRGLNRQ
jgi:hypothetical protein